MNAFDLSIPVILVLTAIAGGAGMCIAKFSGKEDSAPEEVSECVVERGLEKALGLEEGQLKGKIDFSPNSPEGNDE